MQNERDFSTDTYVGAENVASTKLALAPGVTFGVVAERLMDRSCDVALRHGNLEFYPGKKRVLVGGEDEQQEVRTEGLGKIKTKLLLYFYFNADRIIRNVWGDDYTSHNSLSAHVLGLREKIGVERVQTVRGIGFRFLDPSSKEMNLPESGDSEEILGQSPKIIGENGEQNLTLLEWKLLCEMMKNRGMVLTRNRLINLAWDTDAPGGLYIVNQKISQIRKKLDLLGLNGKEIIQTVWGVGYKYMGERLTVYPEDILD